MKQKYIVRWWLDGDKKPRTAEFFNAFTLDFFVRGLAKNPKLAKIETVYPEGW